MIATHLRITIIINDIKGEIYQHTAKYREKLGKVIKIAWDEEDSSCYNFLSLENLPQDDADLEEYINQIWHKILPQAEQGDPYWSDNSRNLGIALTAYYCKISQLENKETSFNYIINEFLKAYSEIDNNDQQDDEELQGNALKNYYNQLIQNAKRLQLPSFCYFTLGEHYNTEYKQRGTFAQGFTTALKIFTYKKVARTTSNSDFNFKDIRNESVTIYLNIPIDKIKIYSKLTNIFISLLTQFLIKEKYEDIKDKQNILFIIDEFPQLGKSTELIETLPSVGRGQKCSLLAIAQSIGQVETIYGKGAVNTLLSNSQYTVIFNQTSYDQAKTFENLISSQTLKVKKSIKDKNKNIERINLLSAQELMNIKQYHSYILVQGHYARPIKAQGLNPYQHKDFKTKLIDNNSNNNV